MYFILKTIIFLFLFTFIVNSEDVSTETENYGNNDDNGDDDITFQDEETVFNYLKKQDEKLIKMFTRSFRKQLKRIKEAVKISDAHITLNHTEKELSKDNINAKIEVSECYVKGFNRAKKVGKYEDKAKLFHRQRKGIHSTLIFPNLTITCDSKLTINEAVDESKLRISAYFVFIDIMFTNDKEKINLDQFIVDEITGLIYAFNPKTELNEYRTNIHLKAWRVINKTIFPTVSDLIENLFNEKYFSLAKKIFNNVG